MAERTGTFEHMPIAYCYTSRGIADPVRSGHRLQARSHRAFATVPALAIGPTRAAASSTARAARLPVVPRKAAQGAAAWLDLGQRHESNPRDQ